MLRVASLERSSTTITSKFEWRVESSEFTQRAMFRASLRAGTMMERLGKLGTGSRGSILFCERRATSNARKAKMRLAALNKSATIINTENLSGPP